MRTQAKRSEQRSEPEEFSIMLSLFTFEERSLDGKQRGRGRSSKEGRMEV